MKITSLLKNVGSHAVKLLKQRSTWAGLSIIAVAIGKPELAPSFTEFGEAINHVLIGVGAVLVAIDTAKTALSK